jgi:hypothetical protein
MDPYVDRYFFAGFVFVFSGIALGLLGIEPSVPGNIITGALFFGAGGIMMLVNKMKGK